MAELVSPDGGSWREAAGEELRQSIDDILYTEKTHFAAAERLQKVHWTWGAAATVLATAAAATIVGNWSQVAAALLALAAAIVSGVMTFIKPERAAEAHLTAGRQLGTLRVRVRHVLSLDLQRLSVGDMRVIIDEIASEKAKVDGAAPGTTERDYRGSQWEDSEGNI